MASEMKSNQYDIDGKPVKIDKWDASALKNTLDDSAKSVMIKTYRCQESHKLFDGRLMICTAAVCFALFAIAWDYLHPFPESRTILITCVLSYFVLMAVLTLYTNCKEKGIFLQALEKDPAGMDPDNVWTISSSLHKYDDIYHLYMTFTDGTSKERRSTNISKCVANFFDENGTLCVDLFHPVVEKMRDSLSSEKKGD